MRKYAFATLALVLLIGPLHAQPKKGIKIIARGHSFFEIHTSKGIIVTDPHLIDTYPRPLLLEADIALLSHNHNDHTQITALKNHKDKTKTKAKAEIIKGWKGAGPRATWNIMDKTIKGVRIRSVGTYHDTSKGLERGINTIFIIEVDGWKIAHCGDLGHTLTKKQIKAIGKIDVLMLPVGGVYTINGGDALTVVKQLKPKEYIIPMHFGTPVFSEVLDETEFIDGFPLRRVVLLRNEKTAPKNRLILNRDVNRPRPLVVVMHWKDR